MCLSVSVFELTEPELPPRQGTEAAGSSNATANTRTAQKFFKLNLRLIIINLKIFYRILVDHPPTETDQTTPTASKKEKKDKKKNRTASLLVV